MHWTDIVHIILGALSGMLLIVGFMLMLKGAIVQGAVLFSLSHLITVAFLMYQSMERESLDVKLQDIFLEYFVPYLASQVFTLLLLIPHIV